MKNNCSMLGLSLVTSVFLVGCNSSSDSDSDSDSGSVQTYSFIDEAVQGLYYSSVSTSGCTNADGEYLAVEGEEVSFYIGNCDEDNKPTSNSGVLIGLSEAKNMITTPYDLTINGQNVDPLTVATILKSFNVSSDNSSLNLAGVKFAGNGVDVTSTLNSLVKNPSIDATTVLTASLFSDITTLANRDENITFKHSNFLSETEVVTELKDTLESISVNTPISFKVIDLVGKTVTKPDGTIYTFGPTEELFADYYVANGSLSDGITFWGIFLDGSKFGAKSGDLYIAEGNVITPLIKSDDRWIVSVNGGNPEIWFVD
jgi:hypothetical protein